MSMTTVRIAGVIAALTLALPLVAPAQPTGTTTAASAPRLTLERLYSLPRLIGTAPRAPAWSPDATRLAFLWNDEGTNVYDIWTITVSNPVPTRVTRVPRRSVPASITDAAARRDVEARIEQDPGITDVQWFPDGARLLATLGGDLVSVSRAGDITRITETDAPERAATFNAQGTALAYLSGGALVVRDLPFATPPRVIVTPAAADVTIDRIAWAPDGASLVVVETDRRGIPQRQIPDYLPEDARMNTVRRAYPGEPSESRRIGIVAASGGDVRWIEKGGTPLDSVFTVAWSPDSREVLVDTSDLYVKHRRMLLVTAATGAVRTWLEERDPDNVTASWWAAWAPDGAGIYFTSDRHDDYHLYYGALAGGEPRRITSGPWAVLDVQLVPAAKALFVAGNPGRHEERHLLRVPMAGGDVTRLSVRPGTHTAVVSPDGRFAADVFSSDTTPPDLFLTRLDPAGDDEAREVRVTTSPLPEFASYRWPVVTYVSFASHVDGVTLHGRCCAATASTLPAAGSRPSSGRFTRTRCATSGADARPIRRGARRVPRAGRLTSS